MASYGVAFGAVEGMLLVLILLKEDETSRGILWVLHGGDDSLGTRAPSLCMERMAVALETV